MDGSERYERSGCWKGSEESKMVGVSGKSRACCMTERETRKQRDRKGTDAGEEVESE